MGLRESHADVLLRWQQGDAAAFTVIVRTWEGPIGRFLFRLTRSAEAARDLSQEVFFRVYQSRHTYRDQGNFSTWLYRIALNAARDHARKNRRPMEPYPDTDLPSPGASAEMTAEQHETVTRVAAVLGELPANLQEVLVLRYYEEFSFEEMGRMLDTPASTLKSRFAVAIRQLTERLRANGFSPEGER